MSLLADIVMPLVLSRDELHRWGAANRYGSELHEAVDLLEDAANNRPAAEVLKVTERAIAGAKRRIARADDSSGIIGDAINRLLVLHAQLCSAAAPRPAKLVTWMIEFQLDDKVDYFTIDPAAYAPTLGVKGLASYRARLAELAHQVGPEPTDEQRRALWGEHHHDSAAYEQSIRDSRTRFVLEWNARRLAVWDADVDAIIATHARDRKVAAWLEDTARALAEIRRFDLAIDWARDATEFNHGHQSVKAAGYWCTLLAEHRPQEELAARRLVFERWPTSTHASRLKTAAGDKWASLRVDVMAVLEHTPREAVSFALHGLEDPALAWDLAHSLDLGDGSGLWDSVATAYERIDPLATIPVHTRLALADLVVADARNYRTAARRLAHLRALAAGTTLAPGVDQLIANLREEHRRRPRLQQEFTRAGLP